MAKYENPADKLRRADKDRQARLSDLGAMYDDLVIAAHHYGIAHKRALEAGWQGKQLVGVGFPNPSGLKVPDAPPELLNARRAVHADSQTEEWNQD